MIKSIFTLTLFLILQTATVLGQKPSLAIHVSNPLGFFNKAGIKLEYQRNRFGILIGAARYFDNFVPHYPGNQFLLESRWYQSQDSTRNGRGFLYSKLLAGHLRYRPFSGSGFTAIQEVPEADYWGFGFGVGKKFTFGIFFLELSTGAKIVFPSAGQKNAFYVTGPGSVLDLKFNFGLQL